MEWQETDCKCNPNHPLEEEMIHMSQSTLNHTFLI